MLWIIQISLELLDQAEQKLPLVEKFGVLVHVAKLQLSAVCQAVAHAQISPVLIKIIHLTVATNISFQINKQLVGQ